VYKHIGNPCDLLLKEYATGVDKKSSPLRNPLSTFIGDS